MKKWFVLLVVGMLTASIKPMEDRGVVAASALYVQLVNAINEGAAGLAINLCESQLYKLSRTELHNLSLLVKNQFDALDLLEPVFRSKEIGDLEAAMKEIPVKKPGKPLSRKKMIHWKDHVGLLLKNKKECAAITLDNLSPASSSYPWAKTVVETKRYQSREALVSEKNKLGQLLQILQNALNGIEQAVFFRVYNR